MGKGIRIKDKRPFYYLNSRTSHHLPKITNLGIMNRHPFIDRIRNGASATNHFLTLPSPWTAELAGLAGFDSVTIDMQHGLMDLNQTQQMIVALSATSTAAIVRIPWNSPDMAMKVLDAGAHGVLCPMIENAAQVEYFVRACQYPPGGIRSYGPIRAKAIYGDSYFEDANDYHIKIAMIETRASLDNLEEIAKVQGLDCLLVGPSDLSLSMGLPKRADLSHPDMIQALKSVLEVCRVNELIPAVFTLNLEEMGQMAQMGFQLISCTSDTGLLSSQLKTLASGMREHLNAKN